MQKRQYREDSIGLTILLMALAYLFSMAVRMYWPIHFSGAAFQSMYYDATLMINTNDGYFFASGAKDILNNVIPQDGQRISAYGFGLSEVTAFFTRLLPFSLETVILYMPAVISSLLVIPIVLTGRLMGHTFLGFLAALLGSITWSYYNRTMVGYYDSDMFAIFLQFFIFYTFLYIAYKKDIRGIIFAAFLILIYPYFYPQGISITYAIFIALVFYLILEYKGILKTKETNDFKEGAMTFYGSIILLSIALMMTLPIWIRIILFVVALTVLLKGKLKEKQLVYFALIVFIGFLYFGNILGVILPKLMGYMNRGVSTEGLHFYQVIQTVREAGAIPMSTVADRISGSSFGLLLSFVGFILLIIRHKPFIIAIPLIGVGLFSYIGGLRFTVYAVPVAAMSAIYLFYYLFNTIKDNKQRVYILGAVSFGFFLEHLIDLTQKYIIPEQRSFIEALGIVVFKVWLTIKEIFLKFYFDLNKTEIYNILIPLMMLIIAIAIYLLIEKNKYKISKIIFTLFLTFLMLVPNITHIIGYKVPTVLKKAEVQDLVKLDQMSSRKDYTLSWWDYGYPIWYYSDTSTLIDGGKHHNDNFIISKIMQTTSPQLAANLSRLAVETYVSSDYKKVANTLFKNNQKDQLDPNLFLSELEDTEYKLPKKTRDIYLYLPFRMMRIFPTVAIFGNLDLTTGKQERKISFYPASAIGQKNNIITLNNGITFDAKKGETTFGTKTKKVKHFIVTQNTKQNKLQIQSQLYHVDGEYAIVYMKSYNQFIVMDVETFNSMYVQMFMLEKYDKNLFELVISSPYSKIYKLKK